MERIRVSLDTYAMIAGAAMRQYDQTGDKRVGDAVEVQLRSETVANLRRFNEDPEIALRMVLSGKRTLH